jgi:hypothetical protein
MPPFFGYMKWRAVFLTPLFGLWNPTIFRLAHSVVYIHNTIGRYWPTASENRMVFLFG